MLAAIPGYAHLRVYIPDEPERDPAHDVTDIDVLHRYAPLLQIALEVISGVRPGHQVRHSRFGSAVRIHIAARRRGSGTEKISGPVAVKSLHSRPSSTEADGWELFGTALIGATQSRHRYGFTAVCSGEQLVSLRVLSG